MDPVPNLQPIPHPPGHLLIGNLFDLDAGHPIESLMELARQYGPIIELDLPGGRSATIVSSFDLVDELCDESHFDKKAGRGLAAWSRVRPATDYSPQKRRTRNGARRTTCFCPLSAWTRCALTTRACSMSLCSSCKNGSG